MLEWWLFDGAVELALMPMWVAAHQLLSSTAYYSGEREMLQVFAVTACRPSHNSTVVAVTLVTIVGRVWLCLQLCLNNV